MNIEATQEGKRLADLRDKETPWSLWGPYLSERQWGTVREDYSEDGQAWQYLPHDHARSRAYRWGEDGIAGISDDKQLLCFAIGLWNGKDPILKERLFGLTGPEGNHGEDVKEYYFYLDNTPSHAYMKHLYKYPHNEFPYNDLVATNEKRTRDDFEYELLDTKIFDENRYFDVFTEYAKNSTDDILIRINVSNRGPDPATLTLLPTLWFRNTWDWDYKTKMPRLELAPNNTIEATHEQLGTYFLYCEEASRILFTENETNTNRLFCTPNKSPYVKDGIHDYIVCNDRKKVNPQNHGTKASAVYKLVIAAGQTKQVRLRLCKSKNLTTPFNEEFDDTFAKRKAEADDFYNHVTPYKLTDDMRNVQRQAFAGLLWNKQCYHYNVNKWLQGDPKQPAPPEARKNGRNQNWTYLNAYEIFSMPDKWEYPWFAAWDLAFHAIALAMIDPEFAKNQLLLLTKEWYMAPDGQIPAYEWKFSDVNPPVQAWAAMRVYQIEYAMYGRQDREFLEKIFQKLLINFTWWVNRKDANGRNIFEGGFLGLDNIGAFNRSLAPESGGTLEQPDATGWMGMYCLNCLQIALELAQHDNVYEDIATKFFEHFVHIANAINNPDPKKEGLWNEEEGFYYSLMIMKDGTAHTLFQDSLVGIIPLFAVATNDASVASDFPSYRNRFNWFIQNRPELLTNIADLEKLGDEKRILLAFANANKLAKTLKKVLNEDEFLSPFGVRSVSKKLETKPFVVNIGGQEYRLDYEPAESRTGMFGGNSNWRGPVWFPPNFLLIESLQKFHYYYDDALKIECPTGSGNMMNLWEVSLELSSRLIKIFLKDSDGKRPLYGGIDKFQNDPHWKDYILFHEYFHADNGAGLGASCQTGWTALVAKLIHQHGKHALQHVSATEIEKEKIGHI